MSTWEPQRAVKVGRTISNMTQAELAERLSVVTGEEWSRAMVAALEGGRKAFTVEILMELAKIQGMPYSFYLEGINSSNPGYLQLDEANPLSELINSNETYVPVHNPVWVDLFSESRHTAA